MTKDILTIGVCVFSAALLGVACSGAGDQGAVDGADASTGSRGGSSARPVFATDTSTPDVSTPDVSTPDTLGSEDVVPTEPDALPCAPSCDGKTCGDDGCGGTCGVCGAGLACDAGQCVCAPSCDGKTCGDDGCGDVCGSCGDWAVCDDAGQCVCEPDCGGRECGTDGCDGTCGSCTGGEICSGAGTCDPAPQAGCGGLDLAENWAGTFDGDYETLLYGLEVDDGDTDGNLEFSITCLNSKLILNGQMTGVASGDNVFELTLTGTYDPATGVLDGSIPEGHVNLEDLMMDVAFEGEMPGSMQPDGTLTGTYEVTAVSATGALGPVDINTLSAKSDGTWSASPAP